VIYNGELDRDAFWAVAQAIESTPGVVSDAWQLFPYLYDIADFRERTTSGMGGGAGIVTSAGTQPDLPLKRKRVSVASTCV